MNLNIGLVILGIIFLLLILRANIAGIIVGAVAGYAICAFVGPNLMRNT